MLDKTSLPGPPQHHTSWTQQQPSQTPTMQPRQNPRKRHQNETMCVFHNLNLQHLIRHHQILLIPPHAIPKARIAQILSSLTAQNIQVETETLLPIFLRNIRLDRPRAVVVLKRPEAADCKPPGAPAATDSAGRRLESHAFARLDKGPGIVAGVAVWVLADDVVEVEGVKPGSG